MRIPSSAKRTANYLMEPIESGYVKPETATEAAGQLTNEESY